MSTLIASNPVVETRQGKLAGTISGDVRIFKGIPYAAPPFGENRFRPPQPVQPWSGVREAFAFGAKPAGPPYPKPWDELIPELDTLGEDCLTLNIWAPDAPATGLPVMVWIPGGQFEHGTSASLAYDGSRFARDGVVCVTINYRVAGDGFLYLGDGCANLGLLDQIAALEWVRDNIRSFGGDPDNVTVFGQSAGAMSIGILLSMPRAGKLFQRAIAQSGGSQMVIPADEARRVTLRLSEHLGISPNREAFAAVPLDRFIEAQVEMKNDLMASPDPERWGREVVAGFQPLVPVIDGEIIPAPPLELIGRGSGASVDLMVGSTREEYDFFLVPGGAIDQIPSEAVSGALAAHGLPAEVGLSTYRKLNPKAGNGDLLSAVMTDWYFRIPALRLAEAHSKNSRETYMYEFAWRSSAFNGRLGACHGLDIAFVFDILPEGPDPLLGSNPPQALADNMHAAWIAFAKTGNPGWPRFDLDRRQTMRFDTKSEVVDDPQSAERRLWQGVR